MRIDKSVFIRFCLTTMIAVSLAVAGCGNDGANGMNGQDGADGADGADGMDGADGADGAQGPPGGTPPGPGDVVDLSDPVMEEFLVSFGEPLVAEITGVTVSSPPVIAFTLQTSGGADVIGLSAASVGATFAKLESDRWVSYINVLETPRDPSATPPSPDRLDQALQAAAEFEATLVDNGDGTYTYTLMTDVANVTTPVPVTYDETLTHRAGLELRIDADDVLNPDNPTFTFVPDGSAVTETRDIVSTDTCNKCHGRLAIHGDGRFTTDYCVTCHTSGTRDQDYAELLDMPHMVHAIHAADLREELEAGLCNGGTNDGEACEGDGDCPSGTCEGISNFSYKVLGFGENFGAGFPFDFSETTYPQGLASPLELLGCENCHKQSEETPDGDDWQTSSSATACGGCHQGGLVAVDSSGDPCENAYDAACVDDTTGLSTYAYEHSFTLAADGTCANAGCHGDGNNSIVNVHRNLALEEAQKYAFRIDEVDLGGSGAGGASGGPWDGTGTITFTVFNPVDMMPYDLNATDGPFDDSSARLRFRIAWASDDYSNHQTGEEVGQPIQIDALLACTTAINCDGPDPTDGFYTLTIDETPPIEVVGDSIGIAMEGRARVDVDSSGSTNSIPITSQIAYANIDDVSDAATDRREIVSIDRCNDCHGMVSLHGENRTNNVQVCATCHNPNATDIGDRGFFCVGGSEANSGCDPDADPTECPDGVCTEFTGEATIDMKVMIHQIHAANAVITGRSLHDYTHVTYPRHLRLPNECNACHLEGTYYPQDTTTEDGFRYATTTDTNVELDDPSDDINTTFNAATCGGCHLDFTGMNSAVPMAHMTQNGASFIAVQLVNGAIVEPDPTPIETCVTCHGEGKSDSVEVVHGGH